MKFEKLNPLTGFGIGFGLAGAIVILLCIKKDYEDGTRILKNNRDSILVVTDAVKDSNSSHIIIDSLK